MKSDIDGNEISLCKVPCAYTVCSTIHLQCIIKFPFMGFEHTAYSCLHLGPHHHTPPDRRQIVTERNTISVWNDCHSLLRHFHLHILSYMERCVFFTRGRGSSIATWSMIQSNFTHSSTSQFTLHTQLSVPLMMRVWLTIYRSSLWPGLKTAS